MLTEQQRRELDWEKTDGLMPVIVQHAVSGEVLMLGYMNPEALDKTIESGKVTFFSRTKQRLWTKGETSGNFLNVVNITPDCDNDTLLLLANPIGPTCHKGTSSCFGDTAHQWLFLYQLEQLLAERKSANPETSYTAKLYASGTKRIAQKVGEEGVETALAATVHDRFELTNEASDLMYHLLVLLQDQDLDLTTVVRTCVNGISEWRGKRMRCCCRIRQKNGQVSPPCPFSLKPKRLLRVVITQCVTPQHNPRAHHTAQQHCQNQGDCLFRAIATNR